jgi:hypothetical protein
MNDKLVKWALKFQAHNNYSLPKARNKINENTQSAKDTYCSFPLINCFALLLMKIIKL